LLGLINYGKPPLAQPPDPVKPGGVVMQIYEAAVLSATHAKLEFLRSRLERRRLDEPRIRLFGGKTSSVVVREPGCSYACTAQERRRIKSARRKGSR